MYEVDIHFARNTHLETPPSLSSSVCLSFTKHALTHMIAYLFSPSSVSFSHSLSFCIFFTLFLSLYLIQKSPTRDLSKYNHFSRILPESSRLVYRVSYVSAFVYSVRKMHINTKCISMHRVLLQGVSRTVVSTAIDTPRFHYCHSQPMHPNRNRSRGSKRQRGFEHPRPMEKADTDDTNESFLSA